MPPAIENPLADASLLAYGLALAGLLSDHVLVACRLLGLLVTVPGCNPAALPWHVRCLLLVVLAGVITPNVSLSARAALRPTDGPTDRPVVASRWADGTIQPAAHSGQTPPHEIPNTIQTDGSETVRVRPFDKGLNLGTSVEFVGLAACEVGLGLLLGVGANLILQGFRMAGQLIDQQTGWGLTASSAIDGDDLGSIPGELFFWMGTVLLFVLGGHLLLVSTLLETFGQIPPGSGFATGDPLPVAFQLLQQSLSLALRLSAPVLAAHVLVSLIVSHAGAAAPAIQNAGTGTILRVAVALGVLLLALSGTTDRLIELIPTTLEL